MNSSCLWDLVKNDFLIPYHRWFTKHFQNVTNTHAMMAWIVYRTTGYAIKSKIVTIILMNQMINAMVSTIIVIQSALQFSRFQINRAASVCSCQSLFQTARSSSSSLLFYRSCLILGDPLMSHDAMWVIGLSRVIAGGALYLESRELPRDYWFYTIQVTEI